MATFVELRCNRAVVRAMLLTLTISPLCSAQTTTSSDERPSTAALPRSRRVLTSDEFSTLVGQTLSLSVRGRWPRRTVTGTILAVNTDTVSVDTGQAIKALPIANTVVNTRLAGDFIESIGHKITVSGRRRLPPAEITGIVVSVEAAHVNIDSDGQLHRVPIASTVILSRTPDRERQRATVAAIAATIGIRVLFVVRCRSGGC